MMGLDDVSCEWMEAHLFKCGEAITVLSIAAIFLNVAILWVYWQARKLLTPQYLAIINVVLADLCSAIVGVTFRGPGMINPGLYYGGSPCSPTQNITEFCIWAPYIAWAFAYQNASAIAILSLDRGIAITFPLWYKVVITRTIARRITYISWGCVVTYLLLHFILFWAGVTTVVWVTSDGRCMYKTQYDLTDEWKFKIIEDVVFFILPFIITILSYITILAKLVKSRNERELDGVQRKTLCLTLCIIITSCFPWTLYFISNYSHFHSTHVHIMIVSYIFFYVSPIVNPVIFSTRSKTFHSVLWDRCRSRTKKKESFIRRYLKVKPRSASSSVSGAVGSVCAKPEAVRIKKEEDKKESHRKKAGTRESSIDDCVFISNIMAEKQLGEAAL